ncbi:MAG: phenylalanine--tRNA ligase subunit alpha [Candidatus Moranbacteria bacterium]|nr:phenylalanine--tRNA ligase subunit alpha [Candidatus Moranbacteria bacterium]
MLEQKILNIKTQAFQDTKDAKTGADVLNLRVKYLGRKSEFNKILKGLKDLSAAEKKLIGPLANSAKKEIEQELQRAEKAIKAKSFDAKKEKIDVTIPGRRVKRGHLHPLTKIQNEIEDIFASMGFEIADGPEVETEWYNFDALNIPADHPARDAWDTFFIKNKNEGKLLLRTHTSPVQIRYMQTHKPPFRIIVPGKCFRHEATDAAHEHTFYQFEALMVGDDISVAHLKHIAQQFFSRFFKKEVKIRLRPSFFPFTEPSFEFDLSCTVCSGKGCPSCKGGGWLEMGGAGMVNQAVFVAAGYPRNRYQGLAWGFGLERLAMMRWKIDDIRLFHSGDLRFIKQF